MNIREQIRNKLQIIIEEELNNLLENTNILEISTVAPETKVNNKMNTTTKKSKTTTQKSNLSGLELINIILNYNLFDRTIHEHLTKPQENIREVCEYGLRIKDDYLCISNKNQMLLDILKESDIEITSKEFIETIRTINNTDNNVCKPLYFPNQNTQACTRIPLEELK